MKRLIFIIPILAAFSSAAQPKWQQRVDTKIDVTLNDKSHFLNAFEELVYTNNSPDTLKFIYMHLWPNAYLNDHTPMARQLDLNGNTAFYYSKEKDRGYIDSLQFTVDGRSVEHYITDNVPDIARLDLLAPLLPGESIKIATPFRVKIPKVFSRLGHTGQAYYISQWFPKPAVYDTKGWHPISYQDQGEFYSEYGSYDVNITLPANYVLMATGDCMDEKERKILDELAKMPVPSDTLYADNTPASTTETKTVHYHEDNVHDFAWFADKRWIVRKDTVISPVTNQPVITWTAFMPRYQKQWLKANDYLKETVKHYGKWVGPYPYKTIKAVLGDLRAGGGMEYPTITIIDKSDRMNLQTVVVHEAGHNWFYGLLGSNERDHAWMDEGLNTFYERKTNADLKRTANKEKGLKVENGHNTFVIKKANGELQLDSARTKRISVDESLLYYQNTATDNDQAIDQTSANFTKINYGLDVYYKTELMLKWLEAYMTPGDFEKGMKDYFETWHFHHPYPEDFRACMQRHTSKSLNWFFDTILTTNKKIDFKIVKARVNGNNTDVTIKNNTGIPSPTLIDAYHKDTLVASAWTEPFAGKTTISLPGTAWNQLKIDEEIPDGKPANDVYRRRALFHHFGLKLKPAIGLNMAEKDKIFLSPAWGNNEYDGFMLGILLHNLTIPENRFRFAVAPLYGFGSNTINGTGAAGYVWYPDNLFKEIMLQGEFKRFHNNEALKNTPDPVYGSYTKIAPALHFTFNEHDPLSTVTRTLTLKGYSITENNIDYGLVGMSPAVVKTGQPEQKMYGVLRYLHQNERTYNPFSYNVEGQKGADFAKINLEGKIRIDYNVKNKSLYVRGYFGKYFASNNTTEVTEKYQLNASYSGINDYLYDGTYRGRNSIDGISGHQVSIQEGGFKIPVFNNVYRSDNWMGAVNLETDLPLGKLPIRLFFDVGLIPNATPSFSNSGTTTMLYDGGVEVGIIKDVVSIYFPVIMSSDFQNYLTNTFGKKNLYTRSISFTFQLQNINWLKLPSKLLKSVVK